MARPVAAKKVFKKAKSLQYNLFMYGNLIRKSAADYLDQAFGLSYRLGNYGKFGSGFDQSFTNGKFNRRASIVPF